MKKKKTKAELTPSVDKHAQIPNDSGSLRSKASRTSNGREESQSGALLKRGLAAPASREGASGARQT